MTPLCQRLVFAGVASLLAAGMAGCGSKSETSTGPSPLKCQVALSSPQSTLDSTGGAGSVQITTQAECSWSASTSASWINDLAPATGQGPGTVQFKASANPATSTRSADISLNGATIRISQNGAACRIDLSPPSQTMPSSGGGGSVAISALPGCSWTAASNSGWLTVTSGGSGNGAGTVGYSATSNAGAARLGVVTIGDQSFVVTQDSPTAPSCSFGIQPTAATVPAAGGNTQISVTTTPACSWTAASNVGWLAVVGIGTGTGNGNVVISATANTGAQRAGTMLIGGQVLNVTQPGSCAASINPASTSAPAAGGAGAVIAVTVAAGCAWTAASNDTWLTITSATSGNGNGSVAFSVAANSGAPRAGTLTIAGQTFTTNQASGCTASITPLSQTVPAAGGNATNVAVTTPAGCAWTAASTDTWISITAGATGTGNGTVSFTAAASTGPQRTGTVTIAGQAHSVTQSSGCSYSINPTSHNFPNKNAATGPTIAVTTAAGCGWTAVANAPWITVTGGATGSGNGSVTFTVPTNNTGNDRTGTITIGGQTFTVFQPK